MSVYRILLIDDDDLLRDVISDSLSLSGYEVTQAAGGLAGLEACSAAPFDLILLDVQMPDLDGFEVLRRLRSDRSLRDVPVLMLSSLNKGHLKVKALELGADDYITKDAAPAELVARVRTSLRRAARFRLLDGAMAGSVDDIGLDALLQTLQIGMRSASIKLSDIGGEVVLIHGALHACSFRRFTGDDALARLFFAARGRFSVHLLEESATSGDEDRSLSSALVDALVAVDEARRILESAPSLSSLVTLRRDRAACAPLEALRLLFPMPLAELVVAMEGDVRANAVAIAHEFTTGCLETIE